MTGHFLAKPIPYVRPAQLRSWRSKIRHQDNGCWEYTGTRTRQGYAIVRIDGSIYYLHRVMLTLAEGPIAASMVVDHLCRNRSCVAPAHLEVVTNLVNVMRGESPAAVQAHMTHCARGHELTGENVYRTRRTSGRFSRQCRKCRRINHTEYMRDYRKREVAR